MNRHVVKSALVAVMLAGVLTACGGGSDAPPGGMEPDPAIAQREAINTAITDARTKVNAVDDESTDAEVMAADVAVKKAADAVTAASALDANEKAAFNTTIAGLRSNLASRKSSRQMALDDDRKAADAAMMATAMKLYYGIDAPSDTLAGSYTLAGEALTVRVIIDADDVTLTEDEDATVAANKGWEGKKYVYDPDDGRMYEAMVYSNVDEPTEGPKFNDAVNGGYDLDDTTGETATLDTSATGEQEKIASAEFDQTAGAKMFELVGNNPRVLLPGSYHGVAGTYYCTPTTGETCTATVATLGFTLTGGTWTFKPTDPETRLMDVPDADYASYGWWLRKSADGMTYTASAFVDDQGTVAVASGIEDLRGTATYMGGAAGKYSLYSTTGGTNDAGHFTARATLEADFNEDEIAGTIDQFMVGDDGESRNWSVALMKSKISDAGAIAGDPDDSSDTGNQMTKWTIGSTAAATAGEWSGSLKDNGDDGVPKIGTGTFYSTYGHDGKMVGAFGANKQ